jgi:hypothetical protein
MAVLQAKEDLRSAEYLATRLGVHPKSIARWVKEGTITPDEKHVRWNGPDRPETVIALFRQSTVERLVREREELRKGYGV